MGTVDRQWPRDPLELNCSPLGRSGRTWGSGGKCYWVAELGRRAAVAVLLNGTPDIKTEISGIYVCMVVAVGMQPAGICSPPTPLQHPAQLRCRCKLHNTWN